MTRIKLEAAMGFKRKSRRNGHAFDNRKLGFRTSVDILSAKQTTHGTAALNGIGKNRCTGHGCIIRAGHS